MNLLKLTQDGSLLLAPAGHMRADRVVKRTLPGLAICVASAGLALILTRGGTEWGDLGVYLVAFMVSGLALVVSLTMALAHGTEQVPTQSQQEVLLLALHGGVRKSKRGTSILITDEQYDLMRNLIRTEDKVRQAKVVLDHAKREQTKPAPGLPEVYRHQVETRERTKVDKAQAVVDEAQAALDQTRAEIVRYLDQHDLDDETCEFWQGLWRKNRYDRRTWE